jgi:hypothetical protein
MTLHISMLKNIFLLHTKMQTHDICHLYARYICLLHTRMQTVISNILMCYITCHNVNALGLMKTSYVDN